MTATDAELVRGALDGSESAFREIVLRYQGSVFGRIFRVVCDAGRAEELAQDTFVKAFTALHTYDAERRFPAWLLTIAHHVAIDEVRKIHPHMVSLDAPSDAGTESLQLADSESSGPMALAEQAELATVLRTAVSRLRPEYRELVSLRYEQELEHGEIAEAMGLPLGTVKSSLHRARKELALEMERLGWRR